MDGNSTVNGQYPVWKATTLMEEGPGLQLRVLEAGRILKKLTILDRFPTSESSGKSDWFLQAAGGRQSSRTQRTDMSIEELMVSWTTGLHQKSWRGPFHLKFIQEI